MIENWLWEVIGEVKTKGRLFQTEGQAPRKHNFAWSICGQKKFGRVLLVQPSCCRVCKNSNLKARADLKYLTGFWSIHFNLTLARSAYIYRPTIFEVLD